MDNLEKYYKYNIKCDKLESAIWGNKNIQHGGKDKLSNEMKQLMKLNKKLKEKGFNYWIDEDGNVIAKNVSKDDALIEAEKKIFKKMDKYNNTDMANISINLLPDEINSDDQGPIEINIQILKIKVTEKGIRFTLRNNKNSLMRIYYKAEEISEFKLSHLSNYASMLINNEIKKVNSLKFYHLDDVKDFL